MFGHLKAEDFINLMDRTASPGLTPGLVMDKRHLHLESCARCAETLKSVEALRNQVTEMQRIDDDPVPEPDWAEFRGDVRNSLLSRSVKRESTNRSWLGGMGWKPAAAWGLSLLLVFGLTSVVLWNQNEMGTSVGYVAAVDELLEPAGTINAIASMSRSDVFDDIIHLDEHETESLRLLLEDLTQKGVSRQ